MTLQEMIREACEGQQGGDSGAAVRFRKDYSGRGMYGRGCIGVVGDHRGLVELQTQIILEMTATIAARARAGDDAGLADAEAEFEENLVALLNYSTDSMGREWVFYWPSLEPIAE